MDSHRTNMFKEISEIEDDAGKRLLESGENIFIILMGRPRIHLAPDSMVKSMEKSLQKNIAKNVQKQKSGKELVSKYQHKMYLIFWK